MPDHTPPVISNLPQEVFEIFTSHLSTGDLVHCVRVNRTWSDLFLPQLWKTIEIRDRTDYNKFNTHDTLKALLRNCHYIQTLHTCNIKWIWALTSMTTRCRNLRSLTLVRDRNALSVSSELVTLPPRDVEASYARQAICVSCALPILLRQNRRLQHAKIEGFIFHPSAGCRTLDYILRSLPTQSLDRLDINCKSFLTSKSPADDIDPTVFQDGEEGDGQEDDRPYALKELTLSGRIESIDALFAFLERCPRLESLILRSVSDVPYDQLSAILRKHCPLLSRLQWESENCIEGDAEVANLLDASSSSSSSDRQDGGSGGGWKSIQLPFMRNFGPLSTQALLRHASTLTQLGANGWGSLSSSDIQTLLCSAPGLENLNGQLVVHSTCDGRVTEMILSAQDIMHSTITWAGTTSLKHLRLVIHGVPRSDVKCDHKGRPFPHPLPKVAPSHSLQVQESVCKQLGAMAQLQTLVLGRPDVNPNGVIEMAERLVRLHPTLGALVRDHQYQCLELSLGSGLGLMSELKELRILDVTRMAHRIGVAELEWMHVNWPKLETIEGLFSHRLWEGHGNGDWDGSEAVQDWTNAHPLGVGSSFYN